MSNNRKRISIARAIEYKEIAKRNAERELECKRRGLWTLWQHQTQYKTLWHFLRASDKRLIEVCYNVIDTLNPHVKNLIMRRSELLKAYQNRPCLETYRQVNLVHQRLNYYIRQRREISKLLNKLMEVSSNENQN